MLALRKAIVRAAAPIGVIGAIGGFIGDIIQPLGNYAPYVAALSLIGAVASFAFLIVQRRRKGHDVWDTVAAGLFVMFAGSTVIFAAWSIIFANGPDEGYLAANVEPIAQFQQEVLGLRRDVTEIKTAVQENRAQVAAVAASQAQGFADLQRRFADLQAGQGTIVQNPSTPQECYSNARLYQLRGDTANALKGYECYFAFGLEYVDPYYEYSALLNATQGISQARQKLEDLRRDHAQSAALELASIRLLDAPGERLQRLEALAARAPQFGPAFDELGQEYDRALARGATADLLRKQSTAYETLFKLEQDQLLSRYFIDKAQAEAHLQAAAKMHDAYATAGKVFANVDIQVYPYATGVQFIVVLPEVGTARQLLFGMDDPDPKTDAGKLASGSQTFVNTSIGPLPVAVGEHTFYVRYVDANGVTSPVFKKDFRLDPIAVSFIQQPPDFSNNTIPGVFSLGIAGSQGFEPTTYGYSIDSPALDKQKAGIAADTLSVSGLAKGEHVLYVQATAADGKKTEVVRFPFTVN